MAFAGTRAHRNRNHQEGCNQLQSCLWLRNFNRKQGTIDGDFVSIRTRRHARDDTGLADDQSHIIKAGGNLGYQIGSNSVINAFVIGTFDVTDYDFVRDQESIDVGFEGRWAVSDAWSLTLEYRKILLLNDYTSDVVFLGSAVKF